MVSHLQVFEVLVPGVIEVLVPGVPCWYVRYHKYNSQKSKSQDSSTRARIKRMIPTAVSGIYPGTVYKYIQVYVQGYRTVLFQCSDSVPWVYNVPSIRDDHVLLVWSASLPGLTRYVAFFQNIAERYV